MQITDLKPFTYFRSGSRGFLLVDVWPVDHKLWPNQVVLLEFGHLTAIRQKLTDFYELVKAGKMELFTPKAVV